MDSFTPDDLRALSQDELIELVLQQAEAIRQLQAELAKLKKPPTTSLNSSQPPSRDWKTKRANRQRHKKGGAKVGHSKAERPLVDKPDQVIPAKVTVCSKCGTDLSQVEPTQTIRRQVTELPEVKPVVIETRQEVVICPCCRSEQHGKLPEGLEAMRQFGPRLEATVTYFHHEQHMGFERVQTVLQDVFGTSLSEGGAVAIIKRAGEAAQPGAEAIGEQVKQSQVIGSDETSARVNGDNWWEWVFRSEVGEYHVICRSRGQDVIEAFMGDHQAEVWQSDCWKPQLNAPATLHQLCLPHQLRNLQGLIDQFPRLLWGKEMQALFREAIHLAHRRTDLTERGFKRQVICLEQRLDRLLKRRLQAKAARTLQNRYRTHRDHLLVFLHRSDVSPDNNACERALRPSVIHRKVLGSFRSEWGPRAYAALATVLNTVKRKGENVFSKLVSLMGQPVLHFLQPSIA